MTSVHRHFFRVVALTVLASAMVAIPPASGAGAEPLPAVDAAPSDGAELVVDIAADDWVPSSGATVSWTIRVENRSNAAEDAADPSVWVSVSGGAADLELMGTSLPEGWSQSWDDGGTQLSIASPDPLAIGDSFTFIVTTTVTGSMNTDGTLRVNAQASNQWWNAPRPGQGAGRSVIIGGSHFSGTVVADTGSSLRDVCVEFSDYDNSGWWSTTTRFDGTWDIAVPSGYNADVRFQPGCQASYGSAYATTHAVQWWPGVTNPEKAEELSTSTGRDLGTVTLGLGGAISGTVTVPDGVDPTGIAVDVLLPDSGWWIESQSVAADGTWMIDGLTPDAYVVRYEGPGVARQYHDGAGNHADATPLAVSAGILTSDVGAALVAPSTIAGVVTDAATGAPLGGIRVEVVDDADNWVDDTTTRADGSYEITGLAAGSYMMQFAAPDGSHVRVFHDGSWRASDAAPLVVGSAETVAVDVTMSAGVSVSGRIGAGRSAHGVSVGDPIPDVAVIAWTGALDFDSEPIAYAITDADGMYTLTGLPPTEIAIAYIHGLALSEDGALDPDWGIQFWPGVSNPMAAGVLDLGDSAAITAGVDVTLLPVSTVSGRVLDAHGGTLAGSTGLEGMAIAMFLPFDNQPFSVTTTDADGAFEMAVPFADVEFYLGTIDMNDVHDGAYPPLWFGGAAIDVSDFDDIDPAADGAAAIAAEPGTARTGVHLSYDPPAPPSAPATPAVQADDGSLIVSWAPVDGPVDEYLVLVDGAEVASIAAGSDTSGLALAAAPQFAIEGLSNGTTYEISVQARNLGGVSAASVVVAGTPGTVDEPDPDTTDPDPTLPAETDPDPDGATVAETPDPGTDTTAQATPAATSTDAARLAITGRSPTFLLMVAAVLILAGSGAVTSSRLRFVMVRDRGRPLTGR